VSVDIATLQALHAPFVGAVTQLDDAIQNVRGLVAQVEACWHGAAADAFMQTNSEWQQGISQLYQALEGIEQRLKTAGVSYGDLEVQLQRMNSLQ
jgi:WXG100 family type VII secretion target